MNISLITIEEFEKNIYNEYIKLFPKEEQREWKKIRDTYNKGIEKFYKIELDKTIIGFFMLEKIDNEPYYLDYFGIYKEYQNKGYGTLSIRYLLDNIIYNDGLLIEIEKVCDEITNKRYSFYNRLGFKLINSEYLLYKVLYNPMIYTNSDIGKEKVDSMLFKYYIINCGEEEINKNCKIIR